MRLKAKLQSNVFTNKFPENDVIVFTNKMTVPVNSDYSSVIKDDKSVCILSDSICKRIKVNELNKYIKNKKAYKRCFDGADIKALHYAIHTLTNNKPDIVIINISSNNMRRDKPISKADEIINIVTLCNSCGVHEILVRSNTTTWLSNQNILIKYYIRNKAR